ncbi:MAG: DNA polymerase I [Bulleidia sp.]
MKKLLLTDGNAMLFRAYYATAYGRPMTTSDGTPVNAVFGFASMLAKAIEIVQPDGFMVAFDAGKHTFRHDLFPDYKGGRKETPEELKPQFGMAREFLTSFGIHWVEMQDIEADDLIGTVSRMYPDTQTYILTSDHDLLQLADDATTVLLMKKGITEMDVMTPEAIEEQYGITPKQIIDLKGLMGDASDNYPGIPGVGEKTAIKLLKEYGSVENVLAHEDQIRGALGKKVKEGHDSAVLSRKLAEIRTDVDVKFTEEELSFTPDYAGVVKYLESLEMRKLAERFRQAGMQENTVEPEVKEVHSHTMVNRIPDILLQQDCAVYLDDEPVSTDVSRTYGFALSDGTTAVYITLEDAKKDEAFLAYLKQETPHKIGYDIKRSVHLMKKEGIDINWHDDVMIMANLADSTLTSTDKIKDTCGMKETVTFADVYGKPNKPVLLIDSEKQLTHGCEWADFIMELYQKFDLKLREFGMEKLYREMEMPLTFILEEMEEIGIRCDSGVLDEISREIQQKLNSESETIFELAGRQFNINSPKQLGEVLYDDLGLYGGKKRSTSADALAKLADYHPIISHILTYRKYAKIYSTYSDGLQKYISRDGRIHTVYNQCATQTGRLSSSEPNLQNISVRDEEGRQIRKAFLPDEGCVLISSDYHQVELRILAHMADEKSLIQTFRDNVDVHTKTAMDVFGKQADEVTPQDRRKAKAVNFGIVYGISDFGLAEQIDSTRAEAKAFIEAYYQAYPGIRSYMDSVVKSCEKNGYVETLCGRRREIPEIHAGQFMQKEFGKRAAMNAPIQGTAADLIKIAMIRIDAMMKQQGVKSRMILQVHDELIFNVPEDEIDLMKQIIEEGMSKAMELKVPLTVECSVGKTWYEAK